MKNENVLSDTIKDLENFKDHLRQAAENTADVKEGTSTPEEEKQEPSYILYNAIAENSINILKLPSFAQGFNEIADKLGDDIAVKFAELMAIGMTHSAYNAISLYDSMLKEELIKQFDNYGRSLNECIGKVNGLNGAMEVFKKRLDDFNKSKQVDHLKSQIN